MQDKIKILNVGFPKVGNTWIGRTLSDALNAKFCEYDSRGNFLPDTKDKEVLLRISGNNPKRERTAVEKIEKTHFPYHLWRNNDPELKLLIILITRDPRDVAISFFYYTYYHRPFVESGQIKKCSYLKRKFFIFKTIFSYFTHKESWEPYIVATLSYEDMWNDSHSTLINLLKNQCINYDDNQLKEAIHYHSWKHLAKGRKPGDSLNTSFLRSGITGSYKEEFDLIDHLSFYCANACCKIHLKIKQIGTLIHYQQNRKI